MLLYIIDGFNLVHKIPPLKKSSTPHQDLIHYIKKNKLTGSKNNKVIIVFDGKISLLLRESEFQVIFSGQRSADEIIKEKVNKLQNKKQIIVVSDDREIRSYITRAGATSLRVVDFIKIKKPKILEADKEISYPLQREITEEMRKIWLNKK